MQRMLIHHTSLSGHVQAVKIVSIMQVQVVKIVSAQVQVVKINYDFCSGAVCVNDML